MRIKISEKFRDLFTPQSEKIVMPSGRSSGKTTTIEMAAVIYMRASKHNNIMYCRAERNDLKLIFGSMLATIQSLNLEEEFGISKSPYCIWHLRTGATCYFLGINGKTEEDLNSTKGFVPKYRSLKMLIIDECNEVKCESHIIAAETTANKFLLDGHKIVYAWNPPPTKGHYIHEFGRRLVMDGAKQIYTTWKDIAKVLKSTTINEIKRMQTSDPLFYRYWYLGEVVNLSGMVYPQFKRDKHIVNIFKLLAEGDRIVELIIGLDEGTVNDSTCATPIAIMLSGKAVVLDLYEYSPTDRLSNQGMIGQLSPSEQSKRLYEWLVSLVQKFPNLNTVPRSWIFESAEGGQMLRNQFVADYGEETTLVEKKSIWGDVKRVRNMLSEGILYFHDAPNVNTMTLICDIENYIIDERTNDIKKNQREDSIDSMEYATKLYFDRPLIRRN